MFEEVTEVKFQNSENVRQREEKGHVEVAGEFGGREAAFEEEVMLFFDYSLMSWPDAQEQT